MRAAAVQAAAPALWHSPIDSQRVGGDDGGGGRKHRGKAQVLLHAPILSHFADHSRRTKCSRGHEATIGPKRRARRLQAADVPCFVIRAAGQKARNLSCGAPQMGQRSGASPSTVQPHTSQM